jgi:hypothetical protein
VTTNQDNSGEHCHDADTGHLQNIRPRSGPGEGQAQKGNQKAKEKRVKSKSKL